METISVTIPASPEYLKVVRLIVSGLATRLKFTIDDLEDLKIAVDELSAYLTGAQGRDGTLDIGFDLHDDRIEIRGAGHFSAGTKVRTDLTEMSKMILETVVDDAVLEQTDGNPTFRLSKTKRP
ncbi:MAG: serine/threonine-protein kinase RsbW [Actinomycetota bacterium]|jgi:serine/threonine-protein kinase RsbW|nr:serine/threonine-protein kinase RsbW [Actinomycetota bacterium]